MEVRGRYSWLFLFMGLSVFVAATLHGVQCEVESEGPSESECRPYIEKALKGLENVEVADTDIDTDTDTVSAETREDDNSSVEVTANDSVPEAGEDEQDVEAATESIENLETEEKLDGGESTEGDESAEVKSEEMQGDEPISIENSDATSLEDAETQETKEAESVETEEPAAVSEEDNEEADGNKSTEDGAQSVEDTTTEDQTGEASIETGDASVESKETDTVEDTKSTEDDAKSAEEEGEVEASMEKEQDDVESTAESLEDIPTEQDTAEDTTAEDTTAEDTTAEDTTTEDTTAEHVEENASAEEGASVESIEEQTVQEDQSVEAAPEDADNIDSVEEAQTVEEVVEESVEEQKEADAEDAVEGEPQADDTQSAEEELAGESVEEPTETAEEPTVEEEAAVEEAAVVEEVAVEKATVDDATVDEAAEEVVVEEAVVEEATPTEEAEAAESVETETNEEPGAPEEELILDIDIPDELRPREHIAQLLKLDDASTESENTMSKVAEVTLKELKRLYENAIKPLEVLYKYRDLSNRHFGDSEVFSKPLVLFMGPWSGGKSSIINYLLDNEYNITSLRTGAEPSPAYFNLLMYGDEPEVLDGTQLAADFTFSGLQKFGQGLEERLRGLKLPSTLLKKINIVEIPGILEVRKQVSRVFPFNDACQWFIDRADIIFLVYDPSKLDVGPETEAILDQLKGREHQTRIVLNKADQVKPEELMRVQGALIWNISPLMSSAQPPVMYTTSLWSRPYETWAPIRLLQAQERSFLRDLRSAVDKRIENKISSARRFAVRVRNHAKMVDCYLTTYYNHKSMFGNRKQVSDAIIEHPQDYHIYEGLSTLTNISRYDLPDPEVYRDFFRLNPLYEFQQLSATCTYFRGCPINRLDVAIAYDLPELVGKHRKLLESSAAAGGSAGTVDAAGKTKTPAS